MHAGIADGRWSCEAAIIKACPHCRAPGVYKSALDRDATMFLSWRNIVVPASDARVNQPVGAVCPNCGGARQEKATAIGAFKLRDFKPKPVFRMKR